MEKVKEMAEMPRDPVKERRDLLKRTKADVFTRREGQGALRRAMYDLIDEKVTIDQALEQALREKMAELAEEYRRELEGMNQYIQYKKPKKPEGNQ